MVNVASSVLTCFRAAISSSTAGKMIVDHRRVSVQTQINPFKVAELQTFVCLSVETQLGEEN